MYFLVLRAPQAEHHLVSLYWREGRHLYGCYLRNSATHTKTNGKIALKAGGKICNFDFGVNCASKDKTLVVLTIKQQEQQRFFKGPYDPAGVQNIHAHTAKARKTVSSLVLMPFPAGYQLAKHNLSRKFFVI